MSGKNKQRIFAVKRGGSNGLLTKAEADPRGHSTPFWAEVVAHCWQKDQRKVTAPRDQTEAVTQAAPNCRWPWGGSSAANRLPL